MSAFDDEFSSLKKSANIAFAEGEFTKAEELYTKLLEEFPDRERAIVFTNRAITRFSLNKLHESLDDANAALAIDKHWMKAYYRKALALEKLGRPKEAFDAWSDAAVNCDVNSSPWLSEKLVHARDEWTKIMKSVPIEDEEDFFNRFALLTDPRDKLSTLAHFWNGSTQMERFSLFRTLVVMIGGGTDLSAQNKDLTAEMMMPMPLHNYIDKPRESIEPWCNFYESMTSEKKSAFMARLWNALEDNEQTAVITDLRLFTTQALEAAKEKVIAAARREAPM